MFAHIGKDMVDANNNSNSDIVSLTSADIYNKENMQIIDMKEKLNFNADLFFEHAKQAKNHLDLLLEILPSNNIAMEPFSKNGI